MAHHSGATRTQRTAKPSSSKDVQTIAAERAAQRFLPKGFRLEALHEYAAADGSPTHWKIRGRASDRSKWLRPMCRDASGKFELREPVAAASGKVLYRLPELIAAPADKPIFVCEGEACVDALAGLGMVATTSGSSSSARAADWQVLRGRRVTIWGDHDEPGARYATEVAAELRGIAADVRFIDAQPLGLPDGGDVVDFLKAHPRATARTIDKLRTVERVPAAADGAGSGRNNELSKAAYRLRRQGLGIEGIERELLSMNARLPEPLPDAEVAAIARGKARIEPDARAGALAMRLTPASIAGFAQSDPEPVAWALPGRIPRGVVTLLGGHGGAGKSSLALTLAAHVACGGAWAGSPIERGRVTFTSLEDSPAVVRARLRKISEVYRLDAAAIEANLSLLDGVDSALAVESTFGRSLDFTGAMDDLALAAQGAALVVVDNASDAFAANSNDPAMVRAFLRRLGTIARGTDAAVLLLVHVAKATALSGSRAENYVGSASWHNAARSRLALVPEAGGVALKHEKSNFAKLADAIPLRWLDSGVLVPIPPGAAHAERIEAQAAQAKADADALLSAFASAEAAGAEVPASRTGGFTVRHALAPWLPQELSQGGRAARDRLAFALAECERDGRVVRVEQRTAERKVRMRLALGCANAPMRANPPDPLCIGARIGAHPAPIAPIDPLARIGAHRRIGAAAAPTTKRSTRRQIARNPSTTTRSK